MAVLPGDVGAASRQSPAPRPQRRFLRSRCGRDHFCSQPFRIARRAARPGEPEWSQSAPGRERNRSGQPIDDAAQYGSCQRGRGGAWRCRGRYCLTAWGRLTTRPDGGVSRVAKGADCKSAGLRLRRFESYLPHQPSPLACRSSGRLVATATCRCVFRRSPLGRQRLAKAGSRVNVSMRARGCSSMVEQQPSKLMTRVRFPSPAPIFSIT
jgi:hypothetical protein